MIKAVVITIALISSTTNVSADSKLIISPSLLHFDYTEFSTTDQILDTEKGWLPGLEVRLSYAPSADWLIGLTTSYYAGTVDYEGQTQQGIPHSTNTDTELFHLGARLDRSIYQGIFLFTSAKSHRWDRYINDKGNISGIDETYEWLEYAFGLSTDITLSQKDTLHLEASFLITRDATVFVDLSRVNLGTTTLDLGDGTGGRLNLSWFHQYNNDSNLGFGLFFEGWQFGRSNTRQLENGTSIIFVTEPRSETRNIGLKFNIEYMF